MDPLSTIQVAGDSTYLTMLECAARGWPVLMCETRELYARDGVAYARARAVQVSEDAPHFVAAAAEDLPLGAVDVVWMRKDPPFDMDYVLATYLLDLAPARTLVVNHPIGLKVFNEKLWAMRFADLHPPTLLTRDAGRLEAFVREREGRSVLKPWDGNGGRGVLVTQGRDRNLKSMIELLTAGGREAVIAQPYIERADLGDKRIMLFDGEPVGAMLRVPSASDFRGNMHVGATTEPTTLTPREHEICARLGPALREHGQIWVGIDVIDGWLTEINITSPTGFREMRRLYGIRLEQDLVDRVAARALARQQELG